MRWFILKQNLDAVLQNGYLSAFDNVLKYISWVIHTSMYLQGTSDTYTSLQHYPQNNCFDGHKYELDYYMRHAEGTSDNRSHILQRTQ